MTPSLDSRQLAVFCAVAEAGSITGASRQLHVSQPAVSATIQKLEGALGVTLLERGARGVALTDAGRKLVGHARRVQALLGEAVADVAGETETLAPLVIGASTTIAAGLLPSLIAGFREAEGAVGVRLVVGNTDDILDQVRSRALPLGLVEGPSRAPRIHLERFVDDTLLPVIAASRERRIALAATPVLWREVGSGTRAVMEKALRRFGRKPMDHDLELGSTAAIRRAVALGLGLGFLSRWSIGDALDAGRVRVAPLDLAIERRFSWATAGGELAGTPGRFRAFAERARPTLA
ncbi:MAG: LysR family transcriptional regulator [Sandaracinus sp.]|nr:LysR family transcriptional regulator [Sandaracinus sp.]MAQ19482.1 LysR family transcriptional regulator [Sandaracinus sp.]